MPSPVPFLRFAGCAVVLPLLFTAGFVQAADKAIEEVVVTPNRMPVPLKQVGISVAVLAAADPNRAHTILDGLVVGAVLAATLGAVLVAVSAPDGRALAFTAALAAVLALRARSHVDPIRRLALLVGGTCCAATGLVVTVLTLPSLAPWAAALLAAAGLAAGVGREPGPMLGRIVDAAEYVAIAAVIPLACWVAGLYAAARGWHLP